MKSSALVRKTSPRQAPASPAPSAGARFTLNRKHSSIATDRAIPWVW